MTVSFSYHEYRIRMGDTVKDYGATYPAPQWTAVVDAAQERGYLARFERRFVADLSYRDDWYPDGLPPGYMVLRDKVVAPWEVIAEIGTEQRCVIVG